MANKLVDALHTNPDAARWPYLDRLIDLNEMGLIGPELWELICRLSQRIREGAAYRCENGLCRRTGGRLRVGLDRSHASRGLPPSRTDLRGRAPGSVPLRGRLAPRRGHHHSPHARPAPEHSGRRRPIWTP